jgi:hypothetical protein
MAQPYDQRTDYGPRGTGRPGGRGRWVIPVLLALLALFFAWRFLDRVSDRNEARPPPTEYQNR